jgi:arylsulfatase A-like enzyme
MYPTLCEACSLPAPEHLEGLSVMPLVNDPDRPWKQAAFSQYPRGNIMGYSLRTRRYRYTEWQDRKTGKVMARELYDHENDPAENTNLAQQPEFAEEIKRLSQILKKGWKGALPS